MQSRCWNRFRSSAETALLLAALFLVPSARAQTPETAPTPSPGSGAFSYDSFFTTRGLTPGRLDQIAPTARPTLSREEDFNFTWGFHRNFDLALTIPVITNHFQMQGTPKITGTGLGDTLLLVKYRFLRRNLEQGNMQASVTVGPKFATGRTGLRGVNGVLLPVPLQPGSGSTDLFAAANWTYTGLFNVKRLIADENFFALVRSQGAQAMSIGNTIESRFTLSYRPYGSPDSAHEWAIGPVLDWQHAQDDKIRGFTQLDSGGDVLLAGVNTYVGLRRGMHLWLSMEWDVDNLNNPTFYNPVRRQISFGITQQFHMPSLRQFHLPFFK